MWGKNVRDGKSKGSEEGMSPGCEKYYRGHYRYSREN